MSNEMSQAQYLETFVINYLKCAVMRYADEGQRLSNTFKDLDDVVDILHEYCINDVSELKDKIEELQEEVEALKEELEDERRWNERKWKK